MPVIHPAKEQLIAFGQGKLATDESSSVEQHLEVCHECCETLLDLKDDTFIGLVRTANPDDFVENPASLQTDPGANTSGGSDESAHSATMLVQSGEAVSDDDLPTELNNHPRYRIVELIGRGGMGNVYRAEHRLMNRPVAIKLINSQLIRQPQAVERFRREVQAAAKLTHPKIVTAYDAEQAGDVHFLVMEFVEGTDLASVVKHRGPMSVVQACECIRQAAEGLQHAHEKGMVHRDIKPHNLMLSGEGQVRILDFGLAGFVTESALEGSHVCENLGDPHNAPQTGESGCDAPLSGDSGYEVTAAHLTMAGSVMGTPDYIAPEQAQDAHSADIRADIYSLGCTLHFLLAGKPPFLSESLIAKLKAHAESVPESLTKLRSDVSQELSDIVARMMAKRPAERFQTPAAVAQALAPFAKPAVSPPRRRVRTLVAALCMGVAALLAGVIFVQTSKGQVELQSEVDDVEVVIKQGGEQIDVIDTTTGSQIKWLPPGEYEIKLKGEHNDVEITGNIFKLSRWGKVIVTLKRKPEADGIAGAQVPVTPLKDMTEIRNFEGHQGPVRAIVWTPDGRALLSGSGFPIGDKTLRLWDSSTGREIRQLTGHQGQAVALDISRDGERALAACEKSIHLWDLPTGKYLRVLRGHSADVTTVLFLQNGQQALSGSHDQTVKLWDLESGTVKREFTGHTGATFGLAVLPGNRQFLSGSWDGTIRLWDLETGENLRTFTGHANWCVKLLPDGLRFLSAGDDGTIRMWEISSGKQLRKIRAHERQVFAMDVSPDGQFVASGGDGLVALWNIETGAPVARASHPEFVWAVAFAPDGKSLLSGGGGAWKSENWQNGDDWTIRLWRLPEQPQTGWSGRPQNTPPPAIAPFTAEQAKQHQEAWAKYLGVPVEYTNSIGMKFRLIPPGEFMMGSTLEVIGELVKHFREANNEHTAQSVLHAQSEGPQHKVILTQPRYLAVHEVTQAQYEKVMGNNPSHFAATGAGKDVVAGWDTANHPVEMTNWNDAADFCAKLSQKESLKPAYFRNGQSVTMLNGHGYRLPTEAEWEFSCRAGSTARWWTGDKAETLVETAWILDNAGNRTHAVGELRPNPFGLCDMHGNVLEWCQDKWELTYYGQFQKQPALDPQNTSNESPLRVARGGSWSAWQYDSAAHSRWPLDPTIGLGLIGFRVSLSVDAVRQAMEQSKTAVAKKPVEPNRFVRDQQAAEWILRIGGTLRINIEGVDRHVAKRDELPDGDWQITEISVYPVRFDATAKLDKLAGLQSLRWLRLFNTQISDEGFKHLTDVPKLTFIDLDYNAVTADATLAHMAKHIPALTDLGLHGTSITDDGLVHLGKLKDLKVLNLSATRITGSGLHHLAGLGSLRYLLLNQTAVTDSHLKALADLPALENLELMRTGITDDGVEHLLRMTKLNRLVIRETKISSAGLEKLKAAFPTATIEAFTAEQQKEQWQRVAESAAWVPLTMTKFTANEGTTLKKLNDGSLMAEGPNPAQSTYTIATTTTLKRVTALRLDVLRDDKLPGKGPGRADNGTFVLTGIEVRTSPALGAPELPLALSGAIADYSQDSHIVSRIPEGNGSWAIWRGNEPMQNQSLVLDLAEPLVVREGTTLSITLRHESFWSGTNLGRFRLSATDAERAPALKTNAADSTP